MGKSRCDRQAGRKAPETLRNCDVYAAQGRARLLVVIRAPAAYKTIRPGLAGVGGTRGNSDRWIVENSLARKPGPCRAEADSVDQTNANQYPLFSEVLVNAHRFSLFAASTGSLGKADLEQIFSGLFSAIPGQRELLFDEWIPERRRLQCGHTKLGLDLAANPNSGATPPLEIRQAGRYIG